MASILDQNCSVEIYQVGGAVRDYLLGVEVRDRDWVVIGATAGELLDRGFRKVGSNFPVFLHPESAEQYALARTERKSGKGYLGFETNSSREVSLEQDLARRDFTINAMAMSTDGTIVDPFGGEHDLAQGILRHVTDAFAEDPVRVLRAARFVARFGFSIAPETMLLMRRIADSGELSSLTPERVWGELRRALTERYSSRFFEALRGCGANREIFPEIDRLFGSPRLDKDCRVDDMGQHLLLTLKQASDQGANEVVRLAIIVRDLGKEAHTDVLPVAQASQQHVLNSIEDFCIRLVVPRAHRELALLVARFHEDVHGAKELESGVLLTILQKVDAFRRQQRFDDFLEACTIDAVVRMQPHDEKYAQADFIRNIYDIVLNVDFRELLKKDLHGDALAEALFDARVKLIDRSRNL